MRKVSCIAIISIVITMSGCAVDADDQNGSDDSLSEIESASLGQCSYNTVCAWSGANFTGTFSWWFSWDTGCHNHGGNPYIRSGYNYSNKTVYYGGRRTIGAGGSFSLGSSENSITGDICWW